MDSIKAELRRDEGVVSHAYQDHLGFWTIGVGRLIDQRRGGGLSEDEIDLLLTNDIHRVVSALRRVDGWSDLPERKQQALLNMAFQLGVTGLLGFREMWKALRRRDWKMAEYEALDSKWARQTPARAARVAVILAEPA